ncbi:hypothetical protein PHSY_004236 [Pseudozyma hubeiensis SY62]|uniref:AB hydrolase-1 domain-containing protein n=1 Tax=Pseudozyma hubeiensis (strain SY62) TaxID=1305764 RepID=R9P5E6_PSEHS|nr:hypothetical protein PHSY_004236 [Pseudozyma hubeiensis SY62]GAC96653.1 hypothetical protein PHSY_004236 [Pseudozyma hubeiensis SY62]
MPRYTVPTTLPVAIDNGKIYLQTVVQDPPSLASSATSCRGLAIVAHPFGRLGGSLDDPVVTHLASLLLTHAHLRVVRFNSRGVGKSGGSPSWTGKSESSDFQELLSRCIDNFCLDFPESSAAQVVIAGYSAGALYASTVKVPTAIYDLKQFRGAKQPRYILISFPAGVTWALSFFTSKTYTDALKKLLASDTIPGTTAGTTEDEGEAKAAARSVESTPSVDGASLPVASHVLAVYGDQDQFTGLGTYDTWVEGCSSVAASASKQERGSTFHHVLIEGADHFYRSGQAMEALDKAVVEWYDGLLT